MNTYRRYYFYITFVAIAIIYVIVNMIAPLGPNRFNLSDSRTHLLQLTIYLPVVIIWLLAVIGVENFFRYTSFIRRHKDGAALNKVAIGFIMLTFSIILNGMIGVLRSWARKDGWLAVYTITSNYFGVIVPLIAYGILFSGANDLTKFVKLKSQKSVLAIVITIFLIFIGIVYALLLAHYKYSISTPDPSHYSSFYMSKILIYLTLAIPNFIGWTLALTAVYKLHLYRQKVKGILYKPAILRLEIGASLVVVFYIIDQLFITFSTFLAKAGLGKVLVIIYLLLIIYGAGFLVIAVGAKRLARIETVK